MQLWKRSGEPILALAPMANVTDEAFRRIIAKYGKPDVMWSEFVSAHGLASAGRDALLLDLQFDASERPIVAQFFGSIPEHLETAAQLARQLGFDGVDINMGCPDIGVEKSGSGAALMKDPELAKKLIQAAKRGAGPLPVSVKTRLGYNKDELDTWLPHLLSAGPAAVIIHARTRKEMSLVPARWERIAEAVRLRDAAGATTLILGNGDVNSLEEARGKASETGADGVMIGRGIFGNPWFFSGHQPTLSEKISVLLEHVELFEALYGPDENGRGKKNFDIMKKHFKAYVSGFDGAKELRIRLMDTESAEEVRRVLAGMDFAKMADFVYHQSS